MRWMFIFTLLISQYSFATVVDDLESALLKNDIAAAKKCINEIYHGDGFFTAIAREHATSYENLVNTFEELNSIDNSIRSYRNNHQENEYNAAFSNFKGLPSGASYPVAQAVIDLLNSKIKKTRDDLIAIEAEHKLEIAKNELEKQKQIETQKAIDSAARAKQEEQDRLALQEQEEFDKKLAAEEERRSKLCGKDFRRFYVGMAKKKLLLCNPLQLYAARAGNIQIYRNEFGTLITVSNGKVFSWIK